MRYDPAHWIGAEIKRNLPRSLEWHVELFTIQECELFVRFYLPAEYERYVHRLTHTFYFEGFNALDIAEQALINCFKPPFNTFNRVRFD